jgi:hypothetical protein
MQTVTTIGLDIIGDCPVCEARRFAKAAAQAQ